MTSEQYLQRASPETIRLNKSLNHYLRKYVEEHPKYLRNNVKLAKALGLPRTLTSVQDLDSPDPFNFAWWQVGILFLVPANTRLGSFTPENPRQDPESRGR